MSKTDLAADEDLIIGKLKDLSQEVEAEADSFKEKLVKSTVDPVVARGLKNLFSMLTDLSQYTLQAHSETFQWAKGVDDDLDELKEGGDGTQFLPEDAFKLKSLLLALVKELRPSVDSEDLVPITLGKEAAEAILFIDEHTLEVEEDDTEEEPEAEAEGDDEDGETDDE